MSVMLRASSIFHSAAATTTTTISVSLWTRRHYLVYLQSPVPCGGRAVLTGHHHGSGLQAAGSPACGLRSAEATPTTTTTRPPHSLCRHLSSLHHTLRPPWWRYLPRHFRQDGKYEWSEDRNRNTLMEKFLKFHFRGDYFCYIIKLFKCQREFINKSLWKIWICEY